jgi:hypothetical protein
LALSAEDFMSTAPTQRFTSKEMPSHDAARLVLAAHPQRVADVLDNRLSATVVGRLQDCPRLHQRIAQLLIPPQAGDSNDMADDEADPADRQATFERLFRADLKEAASLAGAAWHALSLRQMVRSRDVADLVAHIGQRAHAFGLRHAGVAPALRSIPPAALAERIVRDGTACLGVWFSSFPPSMRQLLQVRLPPATADALEWSNAQQSQALALIDPVLSELGESSNVSA